MPNPSTTSPPPKTPWTPPNGITATYTLTCHCAAIALTMTLSPPLYARETQGREQCVAVECLCSHCLKHGGLAVHPLARDVVFTKGVEDRVEYLTGRKKNPHWFCGKCHSFLGTDLTWVMAQMGLEERCTINLRMLQDLDLEELRTRRSSEMRDA